MKEYERRGEERIIDDAGGSRRREFVYFFSLVMDNNNCPVLILHCHQRGMFMCSTFSLEFSVLLDSVGVNKIANLLRMFSALCKLL